MKMREKYSVGRALENFELIGCEVYRAMKGGNNQAHDYRPDYDKHVGKIIRVDKRDNNYCTLKVEVGGCDLSTNYFTSFEYEDGTLFWDGGSHWVIVIGGCGKCIYKCRQKEPCNLFTEMEEPI